MFSHNQTILIIDDEPMVRMVVSEMLTEEGYAVIEAVDGVSGLNVLRSEAKIDLLIVDMGLPGKNGLQVTVEARQIHPHLRVLMITGHISGDLQGASDFSTLAKPFSMDSLIAVVRDLTRH